MKKLIPLALGRYLNTIAYVLPETAGRHGFSIFCYPFRTPLKPYHKAFLSTAEQFTFTAENIDIQAYRWGTGKKKILFLHGWQSHSFRWKSYIESFSGDDYTVYSLDAPGHGLSKGNFLTVPLYSAVVEQFIRSIDGVDNIISHSLGAFTALYTLYRLPLLPVKKLVLMAPPGEATEFIKFYQESLKLNTRTLKHILNHFEHVIQQPVTFFSASKFASSLTQHGLIIHDEDDIETSFQHSINIHNTWKKSSLVITKGLGHNLKSENILNQVSGFIKENQLAQHNQLA